MSAYATGSQSHSNPSEVKYLENEPLNRTYRIMGTSYRRTTGQKCVEAFKARFSGWRGGVVLSIVVASLILLFNVLLALIAATTWNPSNGVATAYTGDCTLASEWTTAIHLVVNLISSFLLGASNYCMQRLASPTRKEVDDAHAKKQWLDIGTPSVRNLFSISKSRTVIWFILGLSSLPLHLVYNSVIFETLGTNHVIFLTVHPAFFVAKDSWSFQGQHENKFIPLNATFENDISKLQNTLLDGKFLDRSLFDNLTWAECSSRYGAAFITSGAGFGVRKGQSLDRPVGRNETVLAISRGPGEINEPFRLELDYCLSQRVPSKCQIQFSQTILYIVIACNVLKIATMISVLWFFNQETLVTIGDAIQSFIQVPDPTTENCCLMSRRTVDTIWKKPENRMSQRFHPEGREFWYAAISKRRWTLCITLFCSAIICAGIISGSPLKTSDRNSFGKVSFKHLIDIYLPYGDTSPIPHMLLANLPQAIISFLYIAYNGLFTCMLANREWARYAIKRAPLRVTIPSQGQRSTFFLQLPYSFSVPLLLVSALLHWFVSQSIFLARIATYKDNKMVVNERMNRLHNSRTPANGVFTGVGYSDTALEATIGLGIALVLLCVFISTSCKYPKGIPIGGTNSAVISAACHVKYDEDGEKKMEEDISDRPLQWGVTIEGSRIHTGHCSFSSGNVEELRVGYLYAGVAAKAKTA